jgi:CBS domain-containing protein
MQRRGSDKSTERYTMKIKDVMTRSVDIVTPTTKLAQAARIMRDHDVGMLPVGEGDRLVGSLTDRDIVVRAVAQGKAPDSTDVAAAMTSEVLYCFDDQSVEEVAANMGEKQVRRLPVVDRDKKLVGIVSLGDISLGAPGKAASEALERVSRHTH